MPNTCTSHEIILNNQFYVSIIYVIKHEVNVWKSYFHHLFCWNIIIVKILEFTNLVPISIKIQSSIITQIEWPKPFPLIGQSHSVIGWTRKFSFCQHLSSHNCSRTKQPMQFTLDLRRSIEDYNKSFFNLFQSVIVKYLHVLHVYLHPPL